VTTMSGFIRSGQVKALGTTGKVRSSVLPEVPTVAEAGVPGYEATIWLGLMAPKNTSAAIVTKLNAAVTKIVTSAEVREAWAKQGAIPMTMTPAEFTRFLNEDVKKWAHVVKISGATVE